MNDRYLFKAKRTDNKEWVVGSLISMPHGGYMIDRVTDGRRFRVMINPSTICQCTGLKDKNGNLIWENDLVMTVYDGIEHTYVVKWDDSELGFKATNGKKNYGNYFQYLGCCDEIEVIGNIFDNPELLATSLTIKSY
nr:MAG TPA: YopX protein [Caudoviricetes sp.]